MSELDSDALMEIAADISAQMVDLAESARARGLSKKDAACMMLGALKAIIRDLGPDAERIARGAAMQFEMLAEGQPLPGYPDLSGET